MTTPARDDPSPHRGGAGHDPERTVTLGAETLASLRRSIADASGPAVAEEVLFRAGRRWGLAEAERLADPDVDPEWLLRQGLVRLDRTGLGRVTLESFRLDREARDCLVEGRIFDPVEFRLQVEKGPAAEGPLCGLTAGFLTGFAAGVTGLDVVCSPFHCDPPCAAPGCRFTIRPAHLAQTAPAPPSGSTRFFLGSLGSALGESDVSLADLLEGTADAVVLIDSDDIVRYWNMGAESMFLFRREEVVGRRVGFIVPEDLLEAGELAWIQARIESEGALTNFLTRRVRKDGVVLPVSLTRTLLKDSQGRTVGSTAIVRDLTEQRRTEEQLHRARGLAILGELAATVAHEIKNPLAGIFATLQIIVRDLDEGDERREVLADVLHELLRLDETVQDLLRFARPVPPRPLPTDLGSFLRELVESLRRQPDVERNQVEVEAEEELIVPIDSRLLSQAFTNLILNAAQAMGSGGKLSIRVRRNGDSVLADFIDDGPGVAADQLEAIFDPFFTTKSRGTGLGLSIARKNVEAHGGSLRLEPGKGHGTHFRVELPLRAVAKPEA